MSNYQGKHRSDRRKTEEPVTPHHTGQEKNHYFSGDVDLNNYAPPSYYNPQKQPPSNPARSKAKKKRRAKLSPIFIIITSIVVSSFITTLFFSNKPEPENVYKNEITHGVLEQKPNSINSPLAYLCAVRTLKLFDQFFSGDISRTELKTELKILYEMWPEDFGNIEKEMVALDVYGHSIDTDEDLLFTIKYYDSLYRKVYGTE